MTRVTTKEIEGVNHSIETIEMGCCSVAKCQEQGEHTVMIPNYGVGQVETVTLCGACHAQYDFLYWMDDQ